MLIITKILLWFHAPMFITILDVNGVKILQHKSLTLLSINSRWNECRSTWPRGSMCCVSRICFFFISFFFFFGVFSASMFQTLIITTKSQRHKSVCAFWTYHHLPVVINGQLGIVLLPDDGRRGCSLDAAVEARWASHISSQTSRFLSKVSRNAWK